MTEKCNVCGHLTRGVAEMSQHLGSDHSAWDLAEHGYECLVTSGKMRKVKRRRR